MDATRVRAEVDLDALAHNLARIRRRAGAGVRVMLVVKADAYGHGAVRVARHALRCGVGALGVGTSGEALELRAARIRAPLLVLGTVVEEELEACVRHGVHVGLHSTGRCSALQALARRYGARAKVHLNVDTGMGRLGVPPSQALGLLQQVHDSSHLDLAGVMTHISAPDGALDPFAREQRRRFDGVLDRARRRGLLRGWIHAANSAALFTDLGGPYDTVRPGIAAYGALARHLPGARSLLPVLSLRARVVFLKDVPAGTPVGYASTWKAPRATRIATLPIGYGDGLPWRLSGAGEVLVRGQRAPIVGRISMDYTTVDVGHVDGLCVGDTATFVGSDGPESISLEDLAAHAGTIPYEVACSIGARVPRVYRGGERVPLAAQASPGARTAPSRARFPGSGQRTSR